MICIVHIHTTTVYLQTHTQKNHIHWNICPFVNDFSKKFYACNLWIINVDLRKFFLRLQVQISVPSFPMKFPASFVLTKVHDVYFDVYKLLLSSRHLLWTIWCFTAWTEREPRTTCFEDDSKGLHHVFVIGDWGGVRWLKTRDPFNSLQLIGTHKTLLFYAQ